MSNRLDGAVAVVTGGNAGAGGATRLRFAEEGVTSSDGCPGTGVGRASAVPGRSRFSARGDGPGE